ncbi:MAG: hypothetical protein LBR79_05690 [Oscillospiraceae bacterium]|jgi:hypothetical protein|nr:hypothetical protein [Oscillospiraceae bacterium]
MQSHFLSDAFFDSLRSVRFTDRSSGIFVLSPAIGGGERGSFNHWLCPKLVDNVFFPRVGGGKKEVSTILWRDPFFRYSCFV